MFDHYTTDIFDYYSSIMAIVWLALVVLCVLVRENDRFSDRRKKKYYFTYTAIFLASLAEWAGVRISGNMDVPVAMIRIIKCCDYILTPLAGAALTGQMRLHNRWAKALNGIVGFNTVFQLVSLFTDWMITVDENHFYHHGSCYLIYAVEYLTIMFIVVVQFLIYGRKYRNQNKGSLYLSMCLALLGIAVQEFTDPHIRIAYMALTFGAAMMFIHSNEFSQQRTDDEILEQKIRISTDALTGLHSRHAYSKALTDYAKSLPEDLVAFSIDINGLKAANDSLGHEAGDELICGAASCIEKVFAESGDCYRTGGDEFIVFAHMSADNARTAIAELHSVTARWTGKQVKELSLSAGCAAHRDHPEFSVSELVKEADKGMYEEKNEYYVSTGRPRREI